MGREEESRRILVICFAAALLAVGAAFFYGISQEKRKRNRFLWSIFPARHLLGRSSSM